MKIKKYKEFLNENNNFANWILSLINDDNIKQIVNEYTSNGDKSLDLFNALNILNDKTKNTIKFQVNDYLENGLSTDKSITASVILK